MFGGVLAACATLLVAGCGGGAEQTSGEPARTYKLELTDVSFAAHQSVSRPTKFRIAIRNADTRTVPDVAVTVGSFSYTEKYPELASDKRPIWIVEQGPGAVAHPAVPSEAVSPPGAGQTAYLNTWALGALAPRQSKIFEWTVVPVKAGTHRVAIQVNADLGGNAKATLPNRRAVSTSRTVEVAAAPPSRHVNPNTGRVQLGNFPAHP